VAGHRRQSDCADFGSGTGLHPRSEGRSGVGCVAKSRLGRATSREGSRVVKPAIFPRTFKPMRVPNSAAQGARPSEPLPGGAEPTMLATMPVGHTAH